MLPESKLIKSQYKTFLKDIDSKNRIKCVIRWDDQCGNKHNSFSITGTMYQRNKYNNWVDYAGGCIHEEIANHFPEFKNLINWHNFTSDGYFSLSNIIYHASDTDCNGLRIGEHSAHTKVVKANITKDNSFVKILTSEIFYTNRQNNQNLTKHNIKCQKEIDDFTSKLSVPFIVEEVPEEWSISKGKEINISAARSCANFPNAKLEELRDQLITLGVVGGNEDDGYHPNVGTYPMKQAQAFFNWVGLEEDRSFGAHNPKYVKALLQNTIEAMEAEIAALP